MEGSKAEPSADYFVIARPNCSLSHPQRLGVLACLIAVTFAIALAFAWFGAWLVLPFAGLEVGVLVWAFRELDRHADDYEKIVISGDRLLIEQRSAARIEEHELNRHWVQVVIETDRSGQCHVALRSHGRQVEVGRHMSSERRRALAKELRTQLRH